MKRLVHGIMRDLDAEESAYRLRNLEISAALDAYESEEIYRICGLYSLESDEFEDRERKAARIIG